jgi:hypothetical protein
MWLSWRSRAAVHRTTSRTLGGLYLITLAAVCGCIQGCATARVNQFRSFAQAGTAYTKASRQLTSAAGQAAIDADSIVLVNVRQDTASGARGNALLDHDALVRERLIYLARLDRHASMLQSYFEIIAAMADSQAPDQLSAAARGVVDQLGSLRTAISTARIGNAPFPDFTAGIVQVGTAHYKAAALNAELNARKDIIARELAFQRAALDFLTRQLHLDLTIGLRDRANHEVLDPYRRDGELPSNWATTRREILTATPTDETAKAAGDAAQDLQVAFKQLVEGTLDGAALGTVMSDVNRVLDLVGKLEKGMTKK